ncbi:hypothetical protein AVEN_67205-1 [Araneus ventricosus]|uniref:Uncharacterized protein n=1 Tax=Araneus ventricosus TaxID=182803 RepID=A0A4Y2MSB3_ARAVE|nr:hypothetical protein AVEN_67205-1 [Araneus ventricosus]
MFWELLLAIASIVASPFRAPVYPDHPYEATPYGPQNWEEATHFHPANMRLEEKLCRANLKLKSNTYFARGIRVRLMRTMCSLMLHGTASHLTLLGTFMQTTNRTGAKLLKEHELNVYHNLKLLRGP